MSVRFRFIWSLVSASPRQAACSVRRHSAWSEKLKKTNAGSGEIFPKRQRQRDFGMDYASYLLLGK